MRVEFNKDLFAAYCGLVASGYNMIDESDVKVAKIINLIKKLELPSGLIKHFSLAKTNKVSVNPYFPRANAITALCFFLNDTFENYIEFLKSTGTIICDEVFKVWISEIPEMIDTIKNNLGFRLIWDEYNKVISSKVRIYENILNQIDYVLRGNKLFVISVHCNSISLLHEYLHIAVSKFQPQLIDIVRTIGIHEFVDEVKMKEMGYILNDSLEGQCHALEDCIVRGLSGIMSEISDIESYSKANEQGGFKFTAKFIEYAKHDKPTRDMLINYIYNVIKLSSNNL